MNAWSERSDTCGMNDAMRSEIVCAGIHLDDSGVFYLNGELIEDRRGVPGVLFRKCIALIQFFISQTAEYASSRLFMVLK